MIDCKKSVKLNGAKHSAALVVFPRIKLVKCVARR